MSAEQQVWNSELYDNKLAFVSQFGKGVVELLDVKQGENVLDLGCGTGDLTYEISKLGANVTGMDLSREMIEAARLKYSELTFHIGDAQQFSFSTPFDAVFSNAALHWVKQPELVIQSVWNSLRTGGRFVAEFGGHGNVANIVQATTEVLQEYDGRQAEVMNPWYFPIIGEYSSLLEKQGFRVTLAIHFDRPTQLADGEKGLDIWLEAFADHFFKDIDDQEKAVIYAQIASKARDKLFDGAHWYADYKRIRVVAIKE